MLSNENRKLKQSQKTTFCPTCDPPPQLSPDMQRLKEQNDWLKLEVQHTNKSLWHFQINFSNLRIFYIMIQTQYLKSNAKSANFKLTCWNYDTEPQVL
jgi:hypothetical protein